MRSRLAVSAVLALGALAAAFPQTAPSSQTASGLELLQQAGQQVSDAEAYYISAVEEQTSTNQFSRTWQKTILTAAERPGDLYFFEGSSELGHALTVADGKTVWRYRASENRYTANPQAPGPLKRSTMITQSENAMARAEVLERNLATIAGPFQSATRLSDTNLMVSGHKIACEVVRVQTADLKRTRPDYSFERTIWIEKKNQTVVRIVEHGHGYLLSGAARIPLDTETITNYITELNGPAHEDLLRWTPPADAVRIAEFPPPGADLRGPNLTGTQAPALKLKSADGDVVSLGSFKGKPILLDFWATWCGPCVAALPQLAQIYREAGDKGLVVLAIDRDDGADTAAAFLSKKGYAWRNFHDGNGEIEKLVGSSGIPRYLLIDANGKVAYDAMGPTPDDLRGEIAKLGPEYASLAAKAKQSPCEK
jgi:thiol-disulfide isomerase/thioredoxin/outer membrane lipoprotein-sorting protein